MVTRDGVGNVGRHRGYFVRAFSGTSARPIYFAPGVGMLLLGGSAAFLLWTWALSRLTPTQVAVYVNLNPIVAALLAIVLLGERRSLPFVVGFLAVVAGVLLVNWPADRT